MFAVRNNFNRPTNAGRGLALTLQAFFMSAYIVVFRYWYSCTPVYRLNGRTAFVGECVTQRDRHGYLFLLLCVIFTNFPTLHCVAATERQPTKLAHKYSTTHIPTSMVWASTCRTFLYASCISRMPTVLSLPEYLTSAVSATPQEQRISRPCFSPSFANTKKNVNTTVSAVRPSDCVTRFHSSNAIRTQRYCRLISHNPLITQVLNLGCTPLQWGVQGLLYPYFYGKLRHLRLNLIESTNLS